MRGDMSSGVRGSFWQEALMNSSALKSTSLSINLPYHVSGWGIGRVDRGRPLAENWLGKAEIVIERAMKMLLQICIPYAQYISQYPVEIWERDALFTCNTITKLSTFFMTFQNIMQQCQPVYSNVDDADILIPGRNIQTLLWKSFIVYLCYRHFSLSYHVTWAVRGSFLDLWLT